MTVAQPVYRGLMGASLPPEFFQADARGLAGGVEFGFSSTTLDRRVAGFYAKTSKESQASTIFEAKQGMVDCGADIAWLSQFTHEAETLFPPLMAVQVERTRVDGHALVIEAKFALNLMSLTLDMVISKRRRMVLEVGKQMRSTLGDNLKLPDWDSLQATLGERAASAIDVRAFANQALDFWMRWYEEQSASHYNTDDAVGSAIIDAVAAWRSVGAWPREVVTVRFLNGSHAMPITYDVWHRAWGNDKLTILPDGRFYRGKADDQAKAKEALNKWSCDLGKGTLHLGWVGWGGNTLQMSEGGRRFAKSDGEIRMQLDAGVEPPAWLMWHLRADGWEEEMRALLHQTTELLLGRKELTTFAAGKVAVVVGASSCLKKLDLQYNQELRWEGVEPILRAAERCRTLEDVNVSKTGLGVPGSTLAARQFGVLLCRLPNLRAISLANCTIGPEGCAAVAAGVRESATIETLDLSNSKIAAGYAQLGAALAHSTSLRKLELLKCSLADAGNEATAAFFAGLRASTSLTDVGMEKTACDEAGACAIAEALGVNTSIATFTLKTNPNLGDTGKAALEAAKQSRAAPLRLIL